MKHASVLTPPVGAKGATVRPATAARQDGDEGWRRYRALAVGVASSDALSVTAALLISYAVRFEVEPIRPDFAVVIAAAPLVWIAVFQGFGLYALQHLSAPEEFRRIIGATSAGMVLVVMASYWSRSSFSRAWIGLTWLLALGLELAVRQVWRRYLGRLKRGGRLMLRTLVVGADEEAVRLAETLRMPGLGFAPLGHIGDQATAEGAARPLIAGLDALQEAIEAYRPDCLIVSPSAIGLADMRRVVRTARRARVDVRIPARLPEILPTRLSVQPIGGVMALSVRPVRLTGVQAACKRGFDLAVAGLALLLTVPIWAVAALLIRATSPGAVLYRQERVGRGRRPFTIFKFRTMLCDSDATRDALAASNEATGPLFKIRRDPRVTRIGRWLRRWSVDELPQLLNVMRGEMSLVGPRPPLPEEVGAYEEWHLERLEVRPGITGLWQVSGRSELSFDDYVRLDLFYIENWSLAYDLYILLKTIPAVLTGRGSY